MKLHPFNVILLGMLICSIGFNILVIKKNYELEQERTKPIIIIIETEESKDFTYTNLKGAK